MIWQKIGHNLSEQAATAPAAIGMASDRALPTRSIKCGVSTWKNVD